MTNEELRDGLAEAFAERLYGAPMIRLPTKFRADCLGNANIALAYLKQHNDFARRVREVASALLAGNDDYDGHDCNCQCCVRRRILKLCDEELGNGL